MDLNKHLADHDESQKHFHSSGFAKLANGNQIGSTNSTSFEDRRILNENRRVVMAYNRSALASGSYRDLHRESLRSNNTPDGNTRPLNNSGRAGTPIQPQVRKYNPYA